MLARLLLKLSRLLPLRAAYLLRRLLPGSLERALRRRATAPTGELELRLRRSFERFQVTGLTGISPADFRRHVEGRLGVEDAAGEGFDEGGAARQRDLSIKFHWGHNHDFGDFYLEGRMGDRHLSVLASFCRLFPVSPELFDRKDVLDVGCWTGGTSLLLVALGSRVVALEEVRKYAATAGISTTGSTSPISPGCSTTSPTRSSPCGSSTTPAGWGASSWSSRRASATRSRCAASTAATSSIAFRARPGSG